VLLWSSFAAEQDGVVSIPRRVEARSDHYRAIYLAWVHDVAEFVVAGRRVLDRLEIRPGFSFWWMTGLAQKFNAAERSCINDAIKLLALEDYLRTEVVSTVRLGSSRAELVAGVRSLCAALNVRFELAAAVQRTTFSAAMRRVVPGPLRAVAALVRHCLERTSRAPRPRVQEASVTFFDVLVHLAPGSAETGRFESGYWTALVDELRMAGVATNWFHWYFAHDRAPTFAAARSLLARFDTNGKPLESHYLIDREAGPAALLGALCDYVRVSLASLALGRGRVPFSPRGSAVDWWPLLEREWQESLRGPKAIVACIHLRCLEAAVRLLPPQRLGVYIQENQAWEMALVHVWKAAGHGELVGVAHTTVRYWDLRYFHDPRSYRRSRLSLPMPDRIAVNGEAARRVFQAAGVPPEKLVDVEALRYLHLARAVERPERRHADSGSLRLLVCGDFLASTNRRMLACLAGAARLLPPGVLYRIKPHPAYPIDPHDLAGLRVEMVAAPLEALLPECDAVFASNITSAAIDAYCRGVPVIQMLDGSTFNVSPLRDVGDAVYVSTPAQLAAALAGTLRKPTNAAYFFLDGSLPRWRKLLGLAAQERPRAKDERI
jgi:surface carbohydrate biosynthesis protein (TIGR04326 family)